MVVENSSWQMVFSAQRKLEQSKKGGGWRMEEGNGLKLGRLTLLPAGCLWPAWNESRNALNMFSV